MSNKDKRSGEKKHDDRQSFLPKETDMSMRPTRDEKRAEEKKISLEVKRPLHEVLLGQDSPYFSLAVKALEYARSFVAMGDTELANNQRSPEEYAAVKQGIDDVRIAIRREATRRWKILKARGFPGDTRRWKILRAKKKSSDDDALYKGLYMQATIDIVKKFSLGNCGELSSLVAEFCQQQGFKGEVLICDIENGNHQLAIIGKGKNALVCDPWSNKIYPLTDLNQHLQDFVSNTRETRQGLVADYKLASFDATKNKQKLKNVYSMKDLVRFRAASREYYRDLDVLSLQLQTAAKKRDFMEVTKLIYEGAMWTDSIYKDLPQLRDVLAEKLCGAVKKNNVMLVEQWLLRDPGLANSVDDENYSLLDLAFLKKDTKMMEVLLTAGADLFANKVTNEFLFELVQRKLKKPDGKRVNDSKTSGSQKERDQQWFLGCINKHLDNLAAAYNKLMREYIKSGDIDKALQIFSAFPELKLDANNFVDYYLVALKGKELSNALQTISQHKDISKQAKDAIKMAAFYYALRHHDPEMRDVMLTMFGADPSFINIKDKEGNTALHIAAREDNLEVLQFLLASPALAKGIDLLAKNRDGATAYGLAVTLEARELLGKLTVIAQEVTVPKLSVTPSSLASTPMPAALSPTMPEKKRHSKPLPSLPLGTSSSFFPSSSSPSSTSIPSAQSTITSQEPGVQPLEEGQEKGKPGTTPGVK